MNSRALARSAKTMAPPLFAALLLSSVAAACGDGAEAPAGPGAPVATTKPGQTTPPEEAGKADAATVPDAAHACARGVSVSREAFVTASIDYLRQAFGVQTGFEGGDVVYGEMIVALEPCFADWTTLTYVAPIAPSLVPTELRQTHTSAGALWALNGRRDVVLLEKKTITTQDPAPFQQGKLPSDVALIAKDSASDASLLALVASLTSTNPTVHVSYLDQIRILTLTTTLGNFSDPSAPKGTVPLLGAAVEQARVSGLFTTPDWSGLVFRIPNESWPGAVVTDVTLEPECARTHTRGTRDANELTTMPGLAAPLGTGVIANPGASCN